MEVLVVFVTSRRLWARLTRALVVVMLAVLLAGAAAYLWNNRAKQAEAAAASPAGPAPAANPAAANGTGPAAAMAAVGPVSPAPAGSNGSPVVLPPLAPLPANGKALVAPGGGLAPGRLPGGAPVMPTPASPPVVARPPAAPAALLSAAEADKRLADAKAKLDAGDLLGVRAALNDAIVGDQFPPAAAESARALQARANESLVFSPRPFPGDTYAEVAKVERSDGLRTISRGHAVPWELVCRINGTTDKRIKLGQTLKAPVGPFNVMVSKAAYRLDLFLGGIPGEPATLYVTSLPVGLGKDNSTPTGVWEVMPGGKMKNPHWTNPRSGERFEGYDPKNPLGGYWVALKGVEGDATGKTGFGIHGTIEPESIGKQASMGCIRLKVEDVQLVYDMVTDKSRVLVRD
jgi:hypothetical protein